MRCFRRRCSTRALLSGLSLTLLLAVGPSASQTPPTSPTYARHAYSQKLRSGRLRDCVPTNSSTSPLTGDQSFTVPITAWNYHGAKYPFGLTYHSESLIDYGYLQTPDFAGLGEKNPKWSHTFSQWIDIFESEDGYQHIVWHNSGRWMTFRRPLPNGAWEAPDSYHKLTIESGTLTSPSFSCGGQQQTLNVPFVSFTITDGAGTEYLFNQVHWRTGECQALPHYLLRQIKDRWGRILTINWSAGAEPRVTSVTDGAGTALTFGYSGNFLTSVSDRMGRTHTLGYSAVPDEYGVNRQKLTSVQVLGPASPGQPRPVWNWSFAYQDAANPDYAYGGWDGLNDPAYTGDLVIRKVEPDARVTNYLYDRVGLPRTGEADWDGRIAAIQWLDDAETPALQKEIRRTQEGPGGIRMTYPGEVEVFYGYDSNTSDLVQITDVSTGRQWTFTYSMDGKHDLTSITTPAEPTGTALVEYVYDKDSVTGHINKVTAKFRRDGGGTDNTEVLFNALNLPTEVKVVSRSGLHDQITMFGYDSIGNLREVLEAVWMSDEEQSRKLSYTEPDGAWGLPTVVRNELGADSLFDYDDVTGLLLTAASPVNVTAGDPSYDYPRSVITLAYNSDQLPRKVTDAENQSVEITYSALTAGSPYLVITQKFLADNATRSLIVDPFGRLREAQDERGVRTVWTYNAQGQVKTVTRAAGIPGEEATTTFSYDLRGDLQYFDPPEGSSGRVSFDYRRYDQQGNLVTSGGDPIYEGQVTKILYPDAAYELYGYCRPDGTRDAGELEWLRKRDGKIITIKERDLLHRPTRIDYPADNGGAAFSVTAAYDEFGRLVSTVDATGTTTIAYDSLNRVTSVSPPSGQATVTYKYLKDAEYVRWITRVTLNGTDTWEYREDTKGRLFEVATPWNQWSNTTLYFRDGKIAG